MRRLILWAALSPAIALAGADGAYDALILRARAGDYEPALAMLARKGSGPGNRYAYDRILIAAWADQPRVAVQAYEALALPRELPPDVRLAVAHAYRDLRRWPEALAQYREGMSRHPGRLAFAAGAAMTLADAGQSDAALRQARIAAARWPREADAYLALAYVQAGRNAPFESLYAADRAHDLAPGTPYVQREYIYALKRARLAGPVLDRARRHASLFSEAEMRGFEADAQAELVRMADMPSRGEAERYALADRALARYDELIPAWKTLGKAAEADVLRARIDRLHALRARVRMADLVAEYEALRAEGVALPRYALNDVASAYLYLRQPERARDIYRRAAAEADDPEDRLDNETGLYYALAESEQHDEAGAVIDRTRAGYPPWLYPKGQAARVPNDLHLESLQTAASAALQADDTPAAQARLEDMAANAPNNTHLRTALATVYRARSLPRASERELKLAETLSPRDIGVENGQGFTALDLQEWRQAEALSADTLARAPEDLQSRRLARVWEIHNKAELQISGYRGLASDSPVSGSGDFGIDAVLYSPPLDHDWRAYAGGGYATGNFEEGRGYYRWLRAGAQWRVRDLTVEAEASAHHYGHGAKPGLRLSAAYDVDDHWQVGASGEILSRETPLRALASDVSSNSATGYVRWRANERREWTLSLSPSRFSDGNNRWTLGLAGRERVYTAPRLKADLEVDISAQRNSRGSDVPYYNPRMDLMLLPGLRLTHTLYRRYETAWEQIGTVAAGGYGQRGYGAGGVLALGYGQRYRANDVLDMGAMITGISRPYDGNRERELRIAFDLAYRF